MKQVSVGPNKLFSRIPIDDVKCTNKLHSKPAWYIHGPTHAVIYSRPGPELVWWRGGDGGIGAVGLNISVLPSPAERNCVIMPDSFYDSNQGYCLWKRAAPHCAAEQPRHYTPAAENESTTVDWRCRLREQDSPSVHQPQGELEWRHFLQPWKHNSLSYQQFINCKHINKQVGLQRIGHIPVCCRNTDASVSWLHLCEPLQHSTNIWFE